MLRRSPSPSRLPPFQRPPPPRPRYFRIFLLILLLTSLYLYFRTPTPKKQYAIVIDAGSTGSRIHIYTFEKHTQKLLHEEFQVIKPGLSHAHHTSLQPLLETAKKTVPENVWKCTPITVKATAGLRLRGQVEAEKILQNVRTLLQKEYPFHISGVEIMEGKDEGVFAWITVNYLLGNIGKERKSTAAIMDLGGGSTQFVFEPTGPVQMHAGDHKYELIFNGNTYQLYQHSYLGFGLMEARKKMLNSGKSMVQDIKDKTNALDVCYPKGFTNDRINGVGAFEGCKDLALSILAKEKTCPVGPCSFDGVFQPRLNETFTDSGSEIYAFSYIYDRIRKLALPPRLTVGEIGALAHKVCAVRYEKEEEPGDDEAELPSDHKLEDFYRLINRNPEWCMDLSYIWALLKHGYGISDNRHLTISKKIEGVETGWCLGAALAMTENFECTEYS